MGKKNNLSSIKKLSISRVNLAIFLYFCVSSFLIVLVHAISINLVTKKNSLIINYLELTDLIDGVQGDEPSSLFFDLFEDAEERLGFVMVVLQSKYVSTSLSVSFCRSR